MCRLLHNISETNKLFVPVLVGGIYRRVKVAEIWQRSAGVERVPSLNLGVVRGLITFDAQRIQRVFTVTDFGGGDIRWAGSSGGRAFRQCREGSACDSRPEYYVMKRTYVCDGTPVRRSFPLQLHTYPYFT